MTPDKIILLINAIAAIEQIIEREVGLLRARGEMTPELEAAYQERQARAYARPEAQPSPEPTQPP